MKDIPAIEIIRAPASNQDLAEIHDAAWRVLGHEPWNPHPLISLHVPEEAESTARLRGKVPAKEDWRAWRQATWWIVGAGQPAAQYMGRFAGKQAEEGRIALLELLPFGYFAWHRHEAEKAVLVIADEPTAHELLDALAAFPERRAATGDGIPG